jgi:hypothetical protein
MAVAISVTSTPAGSDSTGTTTRTYASQSIGAADENRYVVVCVGAELTSGSPSSCTIDGVAMTPGTLQTQGVVFSRIFYLHWPTGTTASIAVTFGASQGDTTQAIAVYRVTGGVLSTEAGVADTDADPITSGAITIPTGGGAIGVAAFGVDTPARTWTGITEETTAGAIVGDADAGTFRFTIASSTTAGTPTITVSGGNNEDGVLSWIIFKTGYTVAATDGDLELSGATAALEHGWEVVASGGELELQIADLPVSHWGLAVADGDLELSGADATLTEGGGSTYTIPADGGSLELSGTTASTEHGWAIDADSGSLELSGTDASLEHGYELAADDGDLELSGATVDLRFFHLIALGGSLELSGADATFDRTYILPADGGDIELSGTAASLEHGYEVAADGGDLELSGTDASLEHGYEVAADGGNLELSGGDITFDETYILAAESGDLELSGFDASLEPGYVIAADGGELELQIADLPVSHWGEAVDGGDMELSGADATLTYAPSGAYTITADGGDLELSGADSFRDFEFVLGGGDLELSGADVSLEFGYVIAADGGDLELSGADATLTYVPAGSTYTIAADGGDLELSGSDVILVFTYVLDADGGELELSGGAVAFVGPARARRIFGGKPSGWEIRPHEEDPKPRDEKKTRQELQTHVELGLQKMRDDRTAAEIAQAADEETALLLLLI